MLSFGHVRLQISFFMQFGHRVDGVIAGVFKIAVDHILWKKNILQRKSRFSKVSASCGKGVEQLLEIS